MLNLLINSVLASAAAATLATAPMLPAQNANTPRLMPVTAAAGWHGGHGGGHHGSGGWHTVLGGIPWGPWYTNDGFGGGSDGAPGQPGTRTWPPGLNYSSGNESAPILPIVTPVHPAPR
jgi:opacity protein-like surface antigen